MLCGGPKCIVQAKGVGGTKLKNLIARRIKFFKRRIQGQDVFADDLEYEVDNGNAMKGQVEDLNVFFYSTKYSNSS